MAVQVWIGEKPEHPNERRAIIALANGLERLDGLYLILANFSVGGRNIDLVIIKQDGVFIIELKHCDGKVFGDVNGPWFVEGGNGERKRLNPGRKNPYNQVISYYYSLINFLNDHRAEFLSPQKATLTDFRTCRRVVVIAPTIQEGSQIETDWKVEFKGLDELPSYLVTERSSEVNLSDEEMQAIPELLHCTRWTEVNTLVAGILPRWDGAAIPESSNQSTEASASETARQQPSTSEETSRPTLKARMRQLLTTWTGRAALALGALTILLLVILFRPAAQPQPAIDQAADPMLASTSLPAGGVDAGGISAAESCVWNGFQAVGRRRGAQPDTWNNVGANVSAPALAPDVVVTLEKVEFCDGKIAITWSVRNNMDDTSVTLPLSSDNITVRDSLGNEYVIPTPQTSSSELRVEPHTKQSDTVVIDRPANLNAATLVIKLRRLPFGETTWLVPISVT